MGQATVATRRLSLGVIRDGDSAEEVTANQPFFFPLPEEMVLPAPQHFFSCPDYTSSSGSHPCPATACIPITHTHRGRGRAGGEGPRPAQAFKLHHCLAQSQNGKKRKSLCPALNHFPRPSPGPLPTQTESLIAPPGRPFASSWSVLVC